MTDYKFVGYYEPLRVEKCQLMFNSMFRAYPNFELRSADNLDILKDCEIPITYLGGWDSSIKLLKHLYDSKRQFLCVENAYFIKKQLVYSKRLNIDPYYRMTWSSNQMAVLDDTNPNRFDAIKDLLNIQPWKNNKNGPVIVLNVTEGTKKIFNLDYWLSSILQQIKKFAPDREIIIRDKPTGGSECLSIREAIKNAYCVVSYNSIAALDSIMEGVPAIVDKSSCVAPISLTDISKIETGLIYADRTPLFNSLANNQWQLKEFNTELWDTIIKRKPNVK